jgi:hypothetical protein
MKRVVKFYSNTPFYEEDDDIWRWDLLRHMEIAFAIRHVSEIKAHEEISKQKP